MSADSKNAGFGQYLGFVLLFMTVVVGALWVWTVAEPFAYQPREYAMWRAKTEMLRAGQAGHLVILGSSRADADLIPAQLGPDIANLALGGGSVLETYYFVRRIVDRPSPPRIVLIGFTPIEFMQATDGFWYRSVAFGFLPYREIDEVRRRSRLCKDTSLFGVESPGDLDAKLKAFLYTIKFPAYFLPSLLNSHVIGRYAANRTELNLVLANRGHGTYGTANGSMELDSEVGLTSFVPSKLLDDYFDRTLALLQSRHITVYFLSMPHSVVSSRLYAPKLADEFSAYLHQYAARYPNFHILGEPLPSWPSHYFGDGYHLNETGAVLYTAQVAKLLRDSQAEGGPYGVPGITEANGHPDKNSTPVTKGDGVESGVGER